MMPMHAYQIKTPYKFRLKLDFVWGFKDKLFTFNKSLSKNLTEYVIWTTYLIRLNSVKALLGIDFFL